MSDDQSQSDNSASEPADSVAPAVQPEVESELEELKQSLQSEQSARVQLMADFDNFRKRMDAEKSRFGALANMQLISHLLDVVDDVQLAKGDSELQAVRAQEVLQIITDKLVSSLNSVGVDKVNLQPGDKYDPATMEAVTTIPAESVEQDGTVAQVISSPFKFSQDGNIIKSAKVVVYKLTK